MSVCPQWVPVWLTHCIVCSLTSEQKDNTTTTFVFSSYNASTQNKQHSSHPISSFFNHILKSLFKHTNGTFSHKSSSLNHKFFNNKCVRLLLPFVSIIPHRSGHLDIHRPRFGTTLLFFLWVYVAVFCGHVNKQCDDDDGGGGGNGEVCLYNGSSSFLSLGSPGCCCCCSCC